MDTQFNDTFSYYDPLTKTLRGYLIDKPVSRENSIITDLSKPSFTSTNTTANYHCCTNKNNTNINSFLRTSTNFVESLSGNGRLELQIDETTKKRYVKKSVQ